ncbi:MAG: TPM domain-containing protein, partial [Bacteroidota bacterium]
MRFFGLTLIAGLTLLLLLPATAQEVTVPRLTQYATDQTGTLSPDQLGVLNARLRGFEDSTSTQIVVLMLPTLAGDPIDEFALRVAEVNQIGKKGKDNGALLLVARDDRDVRIEVGYGLEGVLTDALSGIIIRNEILPRFRRNDYFGGISGAVEAIIIATAGEYTAEPGAEKKKSPIGILPLIFIIMIFFS